MYLENPKLNYSDYDFKFILQNYFSSIYELEIVNIKDTQLANYNLLKEIDDLYSDYYTLYKSNQYTTLPSLTRLLFEKFIYLTYINKEAEQTVNIRAKRYLDRSEYDLQKFHEYVYKENNGNSKILRSTLINSDYESIFQDKFSEEKLEQAKKEYSLNFQEVKKIKDHKWYAYTDDYKIMDNGDGKARILHSFKELCDYLNYPVFYHICYKNFSDDIHGSANLRDEILKSIQTNKPFKNPSYFYLSILITNYIVVRIHEMIEKKEVN